MGQMEKDIHRPKNRPRKTGQGGRELQRDTVRDKDKTKRETVNHR